MDVSVYCLNVGQANCLAVLDSLPRGDPGDLQASLIDLGADGPRLVAWLKEAGVRRIPLIALTHNDDDHILGLEWVVRAYGMRIGQLLFVVDRPPARIPFWLEAEAWKNKGIIEGTGQLDTPAVARPGMGRVLVEPPEVGYRLHCIYPDVFQLYSAVHRAPKAGAKTGHGPNATSAVLALAMAGNPKRIRILFGGDLDFRGWRCLVEAGYRLDADVLVVPHHGGPGAAHAAFSYGDLARHVKPRYALFSVGTRQGYGHPRPEMVAALRTEGAAVLCTQLTRRCHDDPDAVSNRSVVPLSLLYPAIDLSPSGTACAGTVIVVIRASGRLSMLRLGEHQTAVDTLHADGHHPLCRL
jgi:competence protein ComEC